MSNIFNTISSILSHPPLPGFPVSAGPSMTAPLCFPDDEGAHPLSKTEWWYISGHLQAPDTTRYDFYCALSEMPSVLAVKLNPDHWHPPAPLPNIMGASIWDSALTTTRAGTAPAHLPFRQTRPRVLPAGMPHMGVATGHLDVNFLTYALERARMLRVDADRVSLQAPFGNGTHLALDLSQGGRPPLLLGGQGTIHMGPKGMSRYYSLPWLAAQGTVIHNGAVTPVTGTAWMDHQWGDMSFFDGWDRWKWFGIQLDGGISIVTFVFLDAQGAVQTHASMSLPNGTQKHLVAMRNQHQPPVMTVSERPPSWHSGLTQVDYPLLCTVAIPGWNLSLDVTPVADDQEVDGIGPAGFGTPGKFFPNYWEGGADVVGTLDGQPVRGKCYEELVGWFAPHWVVPSTPPSPRDVAAAVGHWLMDAVHDAEGNLVIV